MVVVVRAGVCISTRSARFHFRGIVMHAQLLILLAFVAAEPQFAVVNKMPPVFTVVNRIVAPEVASAKAKTFLRAVNYGKHGSHNCPGCGQEQLEQAGRGPVRGTHWHVCANPECKSRWFH